MAASIALPCVGRAHRAPRWGVRRDAGRARACVRRITHPGAVLARRPRHHTDDGRMIVGVGAAPCALIRAAPWRVGGVAMRRAFFPQRADTAHPLRSWCRASASSGRSGSGWLARAGVASALACLTSPAHGPSAPWVRLGRSREAATPRGRVVAASSRTRSRSVACSTQHNLDSGRPENALVHGRHAVLGCHTERM